MSTPLSQTQLTVRPYSNVQLFARFASGDSSAAPLPLQSSVTPVPISQPLALARNAAQPRLSRADRKSELPPHITPVWKNARVVVLITSNAIVTSSCKSYRVANRTRDSLNSERTQPRTANCCIVACRGPHLQSSQNSRDELIVKIISACNSLSTLVTPQTAENEIEYSTLYCRFTSFEKRAVKHFGVRRTV